MTSGFLTLGIWVVSGLTHALLRYMLHWIPDDLADLYVLAVMACTPTVWIARNKKIIEEFVLDRKCKC